MCVLVASTAAVLTVTALLMTVPAASGAAPTDDRRILEGQWVTPDNRIETVTQEGTTFTITGPAPAGSCPRPGGVYGKVAPTTDPSVYAGETFKYSTEDCSVTGNAPLLIKVTQDPNVPEIQSFVGESEGQPVGSAKRPDANATTDGDRDGIPDWSETNGINILAKDQAGNPADVLLNLPAMGASPSVRDVFVEVDSMPGRQYDNAAMRMVQDAFLAAPGGGINLHVDNGPASVMDPRSGATWGDRSEGTATVPFRDTLGTRSAGMYSFAEFDALKEKYFRADVRGSYFRYMIAANQIPGDGTTGITRGVGLSDSIITMPVCGKKGQAAYQTCALTSFHQAAVFMHELGHTLGLAHGGGDDINDKPNYFSVMNYSLAYVGLGAANELIKPGGARRLDYSRYGPGSVTRLDENQLSEPTGVQVPDPSNLSLVRHCAATTSVIKPGVLYQAGSPVDWSCNEQIETVPVFFDINFDGEKDVLESYDDWSNLDFTRPGGGRLSRLSSGPPLVPFQETSSLDVLLKQAAQTLGDTKAPRLRLERRGRNAIVTATDRKRVDRLVVGAGHRLRSSPPTKAARSLRVTMRLRKGTTRVTARAMDWAGNQARPLSRKVRVR
jgi:hypothetical protein